MKRKAGLFTAVLAFSVLAPIAVSPSIVSAAAPDTIVFMIDGKQVKISYADFQDALMGENEALKALITGKAPSALGISSDFVDYMNFQDLLFTELDKNALEIIDIALSNTNDLVDEGTTNSYVTITGFDNNGKPSYSDPVGEGEVEEDDFTVDSII